MINETVEKTLEIIGLSDKALARLIKLDIHTIIESKKEKNWNNLTPDALKRLGGVCFLVTQELNLYQPAVILEILNKRTFKDIDDKLYSVLTALESDKFDVRSVVEIGRRARDLYELFPLKTSEFR
jgi:hypothetical protein